MNFFILGNFISIMSVYLHQPAGFSSAEVSTDNGRLLVGIQDEW